MALLILPLLFALGADSPAPIPPLDAHLAEIRPGSLQRIVKDRYFRVLTSKSSFDYYLDRGEPRGYQAQMVKALAKRLSENFPGKLPISFELLPVPSDQLMPMLEAGRGDLIAARLTITPEREKRVLFSQTYHPVEEWVVGRKGAALPKRPEDLAGHPVAVRAGSSHAQSLTKLNRRLNTAGKSEITLVKVDEALETEDLLALVAAGHFDWTVVDSIVADLAESLYPELAVIRRFTLRDQAQLAWALTPGSEALKREVDATLVAFRKGTLRGNIAVDTYFKNFASIRVRLDAAGGSPTLSEYDDLFRRYSEKSGFDWRLLAAIAYQESRFRADAHNPSGATGLFQIKPQTAAEPYIGVLNIAGADNVESNVKAASRYLAWIRDRYFKKQEGMRERDRVRFTLAAYNAGPATVRRAIKKAEEMGLDGGRWFRNVEMGMMALRKGEPVKYVSEINRRFVAYGLLGVE
ncbi:MAG: transporter substrate-binding domain-containing protein [Chloroflexi bacterium]|nr:transporter substrate-binding domain-containing protein [Chloroflexota bacterium]